MVKNRVLVVTGMHRSGTSVITQWLSRCGMHVGEELMGIGTGNDEGHFEDLDFLHAHQAILKGRGIRDEGYTKPIKQLTAKETGVLKDIVARKNKDNRQWGWKDPRTCLFLDTYRQLIPGAFYFVVLRDYRSVVSSLILRMYKKAERKYALRKGLSKFIWEHWKKKRRVGRLLKKYSQPYLQVWIDYNQAILTHLRQEQRDNYMVADYTILYDNDKAVFQRLTQDWGFSLRFFNFSDIYKDRMMHRPLSIGDYIKDKSLLGRAAEIEEALGQMSLFSTKPPVAVQV